MDSPLFDKVKGRVLSLFDEIKGRVSSLFDEIKGRISFYPSVLDKKIGEEKIFLSLQDITDDGADPKNNFFLRTFLLLQKGFKG